MLAVAEELYQNNTFPKYITRIIGDVRAYRGKQHNTLLQTGIQGAIPKQFIKVMFPDKGIEVINFLSVLHSKQVRNAIPSFLKIREPPSVLCTYTNTIVNKIFNFRQTVKDIDSVLVLLICLVVSPLTMTSK